MVLRKQSYGLVRQNLVLEKICLILKRLLVCLKTSELRDYFMTSWSLLDGEIGSDEVGENCLRFIEQHSECDRLTQWFVDHFVQRCANQCPERIVLFLSKLCESSEIVNVDVVKTIVDWRCETFVARLRSASRRR